MTVSITELNLAEKTYSSSTRYMSVTISYLPWTLVGFHWVNCQFYFCLYCYFKTKTIIRIYWHKNIDISTNTFYYYSATNSTPNCTNEEILSQFYFTSVKISSSLFIKNPEGASVWFCSSVCYCMTQFPLHVASIQGIKQNTLYVKWCLILIITHICDLLRTLCSLPQNWVIFFEKGGLTFLFSQII